MLKILLVEDNIEILENTCEMLSLSGLTVFMASGAREGLAIVSDEKPDVIITDVIMPDMDGWQMVERLRDDPDTAHIPVIFLTGHTDSAYRERARSLGVVDYLVKPFTNRQLMQMLERYISRE